jgi:eukaryotic-like serine/threonine-protein kinase
VALTPGSRIGPYEVLAPLGAGGMGEVYRARDPRLGREVALKSLPAAMSSDPDRLARLEREAKLLAALSHPNIAAIYGVEEEPGGGRILVLELAAGETLGQRLARGSMPLEDIVAVARQIVAALEAAHERGIVHRDLKPDNVKVAPDGGVKVLDFGLAAAFGGVGGVSDPGAMLSQSPTMSARMTAAGMLLGTAAYMSPEQARGKPVDKRADIWAFGAVLWEMLCGRRLFDGETVTDLLAAVLRQDVDWNTLPPDIPAPLRRLLRRCLERDLQRRLRDIGEARLVLDDVAAGRTDAEETTSARAAAIATTRASLSGRRATVFGLLALSLAAFAGIGGFLLRGSQARPTRPLSRLSFSLPTTASLQTLDDRQTIAISKDGRTLVFSAIDGGTTRIFVRRLDAASAVPVPGTEGAEDLFLSPDGAWVAFNSDGKLRKTPLGGGPSVTLCDAGQSRGGAWGEDGTIIFAPEVTAGLMRIPATGGVPQAVTTPDAAKGERSHRWPEFLPDGHSVLFTVGLLEKPGDYDDAAIDVVDLKTGVRHNVYQGASLARIDSSGHLLVASRGVISAVPFDLAQAKVTGPAVPALEGVSGDPSSGVVFFGVALDGTLAYIAGGPAGRERDVVWVDRDGKVTPIGLPPREYRDVHFSPDGTRLLLSEGPGLGRQSDISIHDLVHGTTLRLTSDGLSGTPVWSPDGRFVVYDQYNKRAIVRRAADGSGEPLLIREHGGIMMNPSAMLPDGSQIFLSRSGLPSKGDIMTLAMNGSSDMQPYIATAAHEVEAMPSPDGKLLAYTSVERADPAIMVQSYPGPGGRWQVSEGPAVSARWTKDQRHLFFLSQQSVMDLPVSSTSPFTYGRPEKVISLRELRTAPRWGSSQYDVTPDGKRFVFIIDRLREQSPQQVNIVLNWTDEVSRLTTAGR